MCLLTPVCNKHKTAHRYNKGDIVAVSKLGNLWRSSSTVTVEAPALTGDAQADLAIIGGGFTGTAAALEAARQGASAILLEAETIGHGGSGRNVGLVNAGLWLPPHDVIRQMGEEPGRRLLGILSEAPALVWSLIEREGIECEETRKGTLHLAHSPAGFRDLQERHRQGVELGAPLQLLTPKRQRAGPEARLSTVRCSTRAPARSSRYPMRAGWQPPPFAPVRDSTSARRSPASGMTATAGR